jgi:hypothetical protein
VTRLGEFSHIARLFALGVCLFENYRNSQKFSKTKLMYSF